MKFVVITTYADKESYAYPIDSDGGLGIVLREARERGAKVLTLEDLKAECWLQAHGPDVVVLIPLDPEAEDCVGIAVEEIRGAPPGYVRIGYLRRHRLVAQSALNQWAAERALVPVPSPSPRPSSPTPASSGR